MTHLQQLKHYKVLVDSDIRDWIKSEQVRVSLNSNGYPKYYCRESKRTIMLSRRILGVTNPKIYADHINRNPLDNRRENLQAIEPRYNNLRSIAGRRNKSGVKGIYWDKSNGCWIGAVHVFKYKRLRKSFSTKIEAKIWRDNLVDNIFIISGNKK